MRRAIHLLTFGLLFFAVRSCGLNETYDRMKYGADAASEKVGVPAAGRAWNQAIYPALSGAASRTVHQGGAATMESAERVTGRDRESLREKMRKTATSLKQAVFDFLGGPAAAPAPMPAPAPDDQQSPDETKPREGSSTSQSTSARARGPS
jgi:hypothetical protein